MAEAAGSVGALPAASSSHNTHNTSDSLQQQGGSVNWDQGANAQSPRVPRSQISRAHPAHNAGFGERTSAVLSALSGDDETALSAAEAAGEHTSEPQDYVGGIGEAQGEVAAAGGGPGGVVPGGGHAAAVPQQPAHSLTAPAPRRGRELANSPPASTSPIYRANSVVSYTAAPNSKGPPQQQRQAQARRGAETPASAAAGAQLLGSSPNTSRGEFSAAVPQPRAPRRAAGAFSAGGAGLPPTTGQRQGLSQHQHQHALGPSRPSLSGTQSHAATGAASLPSTLAVAVGAFSPPAGLLGQLTPQHGAMSAPQPTPPPPFGTPSMAGLLPLAASMGLPPAQLSSMAAALLQAQNSAQQHQSRPGHGRHQPLQPSPLQQQQQMALSHQGTAMPPPRPLQASQQLQQAEALERVAAMLQAQASAIIGGEGDGGGGSSTLPLMQQQQQQGAQTPMDGAQAATSAANPLAFQAAVRQQQQQPHGATEQQQAAAAGSVGGAPSFQSLGASAIQGHPLPPPFYGTAGPTGTPAPVHSFGGTPAAQGPAVPQPEPPTVHSGAFVAPGTLPAAAATPHQAAVAAPALSEMQGSAIQPALAVLVDQAREDEQHQVHVGSGQNGAGGAAADVEAEGGGHPALNVEPMQQATSAVLGSGNSNGAARSGNGGRAAAAAGSGFAGRPSCCTNPDADPEQQAAEEERRRHAADPPRPQAAVIVELPTADVAAASQGTAAVAGLHLDLAVAVPQEAAMLGGNSTCAEAMDVGEEDDDDAMEVQQAAADGEGQGAHLPPAPHGAASVMATLITDNGGGRSEGDTEMQQTASGPSRRKARAARSPSRSLAEPAVATAHNTGARSGSAHTGGGTTTQPSQQGPVTSNQGQLANNLSSLATLSTGNGERTGGSVEMSALPSQQQQPQPATSAPAALGSAAAAAPSQAAPGTTSPSPSEAMGEAGPPLGAGTGPAGAGMAQAAASAPADVPLQAHMQQPAAGLATPMAQPAGSASMSGQGDTPGQPCYAGAVLPQSSAAAAPILGRAQQQQQPSHMAGGSGTLPLHASHYAGNDGAMPLTDARSRSQGAAAAAAAGGRATAAGPAGAVSALEGMGSPAGSTLAEAEAELRESGGTARATILAGAAHSILTTAAGAAGEGEAMDEGGEALSPLVPAKHVAAHPAPGVHAETSASPLPGATPHSGSVGLPPALPATGAGGSILAAEATAASSAKTSQQRRQLQNGYTRGKPEQGVAAMNGFASPIDHSTMAVDLAPAGGNYDAPQPSASGQPSSLPPAGAVAAALAALEEQQAAQNGGVYLTPPPAARELGELYHALQQQQQNGYATHANSAIGNSHHHQLAHSSPDRELTSPSRLITHDSTAGGSSSQQRSKQAAKRRRTSAGPAGSTQRT